MYPKKQLAQLVISACQQFDVDTVVISPGSRNAPLTVGFSNHKKIKTLSVVDERCAAFFAMGIAQQTQNPVAICCTSGSALLNYYPAIAEAFYSKIPLIVISADRPKHLIDIGDGQTIRQENVFENHILFSANLVDGELNNNSRLIAEAIQTSIVKKGPVHINVPFNEPLYETVDEIDSVIVNKVKQSFSALNVISSTVDKSYTDYQKFSSIWNSAKRKLILVGVHFPSDELQHVLDKIVDDESVLIMTETTSNLCNEKFINSIDKLITKLDDAKFKQLQPEVLLTLGGMVVSKRIKQFLRKYQPEHHWHVDENTKLDTYFCLSQFVQEDPTKFLSELNSRVTSSSVKRSQSTYQNYWLSEKGSRNKQHQQFLENSLYSDLKVFNTILQSIPDNSQVQISNSSIIRYAQLFDINPTLKVFCNRGTSGIDGSTSTAIGAAYATQSQSLFITGDISFFYDSNALWNNNIPKSFRVILINNSGGGIFKIIPGPKSTNAINYFETPHSLTAEHLAKMFAFEYQSANTLDEVENKLMSFYAESHQPKILEIFTPSDINDVVLQQYFKSL
ncbi:2-succinyl-5-enolpyruvyl-6-hydroxy-3-cyclohexene-1-carboxylate synthase [Tenacibaculum adriaticum]|uniref:2-succinyl-5-enolpyruvyl-6-hydroxy-3-cyclohexene-1-carboxylate synthase n=1 Tax=Tenacibaculum adriaticum TaxID=413713 RepID=A0A5S5DRB6_9FLAO|nr:2-succinyl-5-enolpyruvyl-6-hydroxy-3-cyclohexene-1-carboxylic-acid synthase [Tenacibaculum adriaticum]TYP98224.1 2-succinyl-5-enolpyruvyl-6-hydroxy-3-cyclohexene-1-carboxylate synthase [Tenacibaculum adriaticum]